MIKKLILTALMLIMVPAFAFAGSYSISVIGSNGTVTPGGAYLNSGTFASGSRTFTITATNPAAYTLDHVQRILPTPSAAYAVTGTGPWTLTVNAITAAQSFQVSFKKATTTPVVLIASAPASLAAVANTATTLSGATTTIQYLAAGTQVHFVWTGTNGMTFNPASGNASTAAGITTQVTAPASGVATLTLSAPAPNTYAVGDVLTATTNVVVNGPGVVASSACLQCHDGSSYAADYAVSVHSGSSHSSCQACHNQSGTGIHHFDILKATINPATFIAITSTHATVVAKGAVYCAACHTSTHAPHTFTGLGVTCASCHSVSDAHGVKSPDATTFTLTNAQCATCHVGTALPIGAPVFAAVQASAPNLCSDCHVQVGAGHTQSVGDDCVGCHDVQIAQHNANLVNDNSGVRSIVNEFGKWSHHVTGRSVTNADCAVCHLEGKASGTAIAVDSTYHMADAMIHLRNGNTGLSGNQSKATGAGGVQYAWDPANPDHTLMDQFCMSCHNSGGAPNALAALSGVAQADPTHPRSALNPFGDTISNQYDLLSRGAVVDAFGQFDTGNSSHHAVRGTKYNNSTLSQAVQQQISSVNANADAAYTRTHNITQFGKGFTGLRRTANLTVGTIYQAGTFTTAYTVIGTSTTLADNVTIHCGDCHTVGQFKPNYAANADGTKVNPAIGAHGSENEYLLRKPDGSENHLTTSPAKDALVCYLCHKASVYQVSFPSGQSGGNYAPPDGSGGYPKEGGHAGVASSSSTQRECDTDGNNSAGLVGLNRVVSESPATSFADSTVMNKLLAGKYGGNGGGNILGNKCLNCHNASDKKTFGGIHGNANNASYTTYSAANNWPASGAAFTPVQRKPYRFLPGLGNFRYNGGNSADQWMVRSMSEASGEKKGCYTLNGASSRATAAGTKASVWPTKAVLSGTNTADNRADWVPGTAVADDNGILGAWGSCSDHAGSSFSGVSETVDRTILRPLSY